MTRQWEITDRHNFNPSTALKTDLFVVPHTSTQLAHTQHKVHPDPTSTWLRPRPEVKRSHPPKQTSLRWMG
ncbi:hypothetical protein DdX_15840 [Ditylenchus destructor]|uniref:Uncharacterized protein n=1 Tax=Ditylenchus destructor TaxID=166010 RepID=A0AAD4QXD2_9BILA|nr:hypothetical protein DdX_15840 [Ditylenchus destructor]